MVKIIVAVALSTAPVFGEEAPPPRNGITEKTALSDIGLFKKISLFKKAKLESFEFKKFVIDRRDPDELVILGKTKSTVSMGGIEFPPNTEITSVAGLTRLVFDQPITVNGVRICSEMGIHSDTLEVFEVQLCDKSAINGLELPSGSKIAFGRRKRHPTQTWFDISCVILGQEFSAKGRKFRKGATFDPDTKDGGWTGEVECGVVLWE